MSVVGYGIDFGTTNSSISVAESNGVVGLVPIGPGGTTTIPSILYLDNTGNRSVGELAVRTHLVNGVGAGRLMSSIKAWLSDESFTFTIGPSGEPLSMSDLVAAILGHLKRQADNHTGERCERVVLGRPVVFAGAHGARFIEQTELAKQRLSEAARTAGFREVVLLDEATAALQGEQVDEGIIVSADFGGGTFDVSVVNAEPTPWIVQATHGVAVGGEFFDALLFDDSVAPVLRLDRDHWVREQYLPVPNSIRRMRSLSGTLEMMSDDATFVTLENWSDRLPEVDQIVNGGHGYGFYRAVEGAKMDLSTVQRAKIDFSRPGVRVSAEVERERFDELLERSLELVGDTIDHALVSAGLNYDDVAMVVRTGGSSRIPAFVRLLEDRFGPDRVHERDAFATVALGLGVRAYKLWGT